MVSHAAEVTIELLSERIEALRRCHHSLAALA